MENTTKNHPVSHTQISGRRGFSVNVALTIGTRLLILGSALCSGIMIARWFGTTGVGYLATLSVTVALAVQIGSLGLPSANTYFIARDRSQARSAWFNALAFGLITGAFLAVVLTLILRTRPNWLGDIPLSLISTALVAIPFQLTTLLGLNVLLGLDRVGQLNLLEALAQFLLLLNALAALALGISLFVLVAFNSSAAALVSLLVVAAVQRQVRRSNDKGFRLDSGLFKRMIRYGLKFHIATLAWVIILRADLLLVNHFRGASEAGVYAVATQMSTILLLLPGVIGTLLFPRVASEDDAKATFTMRVTRYTALIMLIICLAAVPLSFALPLLYGDDFKNSTALLLILVPGIYLMGIESVLVQHFSGQGLPIAIPIFWIVAVATNIVLNVFAIPVWGATGAATVSTVTCTLIFLLVALYFRFTTGNSLSKTLLLQRSELRELLFVNRFGLFPR
jgi:O-antigen/teichoic acid export membrane protein